MQKSCSEALAPRKIAAVVKSVGEKEDRSKNVFVLGLPEVDSESVDTKVVDRLERRSPGPETQSFCMPKVWEEHSCYGPSHLFQN